MVSSITWTGSGNTVTVNNGGDIETIVFDKDTKNNKVIITEENGENIGTVKNITFGTGKEDIFEVNNSKGIFDYKVANADEIILSGTNNQEDIQWNFSENNIISGTDVKVTVEDNGAINFRYFRRFKTWKQCCVRFRLCKTKSWKS